ncbi:acyl-CoA dehydrogenase [Pseudomonas aeruginosa]|uniref:acyl-CoA dehydrogenase family protein n=1 Tax=Pseudomonas aeruginosa TaxID=287 RepID=UPI000BB7FF7D|nr:acyl-CoA dehydrogenase family protein [Pseudomonas aeruginosa]PBZ54987.1 acyl-CoA dehydrogenase [Pseudomonas aeruginosa]PBZ60728.1 acyl-CoA dehydrogenase [Pseudomonas aeruginosa]PBZ67647.1 acyl-CoA dehydrogenase [Pseudomonas aeruginosa]
MMAMLPKRMADELYHDLMSSAAVLEIRKEVRAFADEFVAPRAYEIAHRDESVESFPRDVFDAMARHGIFQIPFAARDGGRGLEHRVLATATVCEELAYHSNSIAAVFDVHCILAGRTLEKGSDFIRERYLRPAIAGTKIGAFATTEPLASTDLSPKAVATIARREGDRYIINGQKRFITNSPVADFIVVLCRSEEDGMVELVVETDQPGVRIGKPDRKMGNRGQLTADVHFSDVEVPLERRIGEANQGLRVALATLTYGRIGIAATGVGMAQSAFDHSAAHLSSREAFGKKLGAFQHWQFRMAERATQIENGRNLYIKAALRMDQGIEFPEPEAAMAKFYATEAAGDMARDGVQIFGGYGFLRELSEDGSHYKVEEIYRDNKISEIYEGTNEIQRMVIARQIFGKALVG